MSRSKYEIYHSSYTEAIQEVERFVEANGYLLDPEEMAQEVGLGPAKPAAGNTNRFDISLYKSEISLSTGRKARKAVHFQVYGMGSNKYFSADRYELNVYIS